MNRYFRTAVASVLALNSMNSYAGDWQVGMGVENNHTGIAEAENDSQYAPLVNYQGEYFSYIGGKLKYALADLERYQVDLIGQVRSKVFETKDSPVLEGMEKRDSGFDFGLNLNTENVWGNLQLELLSDISDTDHGREVKASYRLPKQFGRWILEPVIGYKWQNEDRIDYAYGVRVGESRIDRRAYSGKAALNPYTEISLAYRLGRHWMLVGGMEYVQLDDAIVDSPIVDKNYQFSTYSAMLYSFD